jgi:hypothetical protein
MYGRREWEEDHPACADMEKTLRIGHLVEAPIPQEHAHVAARLLDRGPPLPDPIGRGLAIFAKTPLRILKWTPKIGPVDRLDFAPFRRNDGAGNDTEDET